MRRRSFSALAVALLIAVQGSAEVTPPKGFLTQFEWPSSDPLFGGLSAVELDDDGLGVTLLSDQGAFATGRISRDAGGRIANISLGPFQLLKGKTDAPLTRRRKDSEGLAIAADGTAFVSFEGAARILRYRHLDGLAENIAIPPEFKKLRANASLESLAIAADGTLFTLVEGLETDQKPIVIFRFRKGVWDHDLTLPRTGIYLPVGADFGPDGKLYVLERAFHGLLGFSSRLARYQVGKTALGPAEVMFESPIGFHDNLEGVAIWRDPLGHLRATMVADNNFLPFLSSGLVEYQLPD